MTFTNEQIESIKSLVDRITYSHVQTYEFFTKNGQTIIGAHQRDGSEYFAVWQDVDTKEISISPW